MLLLELDEPTLHAERPTRLETIEDDDAIKSSLCRDRGGGCRTAGEEHEICKGDHSKACNSQCRSTADNGLHRHVIQDQCHIADLPIIIKEENYPEMIGEVKQNWRTRRIGVMRIRTSAKENCSKKTQMGDAPFFTLNKQTAT